jgi:hypothetical protein
MFAGFFLCSICRGTEGEAATNQRADHRGIRCESPHPETKKTMISFAVTLPDRIKLIGLVVQVVVTRGPWEHPQPWVICMFQGLHFRTFWRSPPLISDLYFLFPGLELGPCSVGAA